MIKDGWLQADQSMIPPGCSLSRLESPHCDDRPDANDISLLVIHNISLPAGVFGRDDVVHLFMGTLDCEAHSSYSSLVGMTVAAHLFIRRNGDVIQFVPFHRRAWHAGESCFEGRENCNDFSIGIELEGTDTWVYTYDQYKSLAAITKTLMHEYPAITTQRIVGHNTISPSRKTDPGQSFDWGFYLRVVSSLN